MRRRDKKYKDYNITEQQANGTIKYILSDKFTTSRTLDESRHSGRFSRKYC